jgi:hypothetical protein
VAISPSGMGQKSNDTTPPMAFGQWRNEWTAASKKGHGYFSNNGMASTKQRHQERHDGTKALKDTMSIQAQRHDGTKARRHKLIQSEDLWEGLGMHIGGTLGRLGGGGANFGEQMFQMRNIKIFRRRRDWGPPGIGLPWPPFGILLALVGSP